LFILCPLDANMIEQQPWLWHEVEQAAGSPQSNKCAIVTSDEADQSRKLTHVDIDTFLTSFSS